MAKDHDSGPRTVAEARRAVEESRERISGTLDTLEDRLREEKERIARKADVLRPVRERARARPLLALGLAFGAGFLIGRIGGGDNDNDEDEDYRPRRRSSLVRDLRNQLIGALIAAVADGVTHRISRLGPRESEPPLQSGDARPLT